MPFRLCFIFASPCRRSSDHCDRLAKYIYIYLTFNNVYFTVAHCQFNEM